MLANFIPEIDGLRFVAIAMVILYHLDGYLFKELQAFYPEDALNFSWWHRILQQGYFGVEVFFVISAFAVSLPFARWKLNGEKPVALGDYFRRLTRIEPPYLLSLLLLLWLQLLMSYGVRWSDFIPDFYYSLFYSHGFLYHCDFQPLVNNVTWSLRSRFSFMFLRHYCFILYSEKVKMPWVICCC
ncbi:MAG: acyltransferase family protein [Saprospiraceae bacterium]